MLPLYSTEATTYYVESDVNSTPSYCPPLTDGFGTGANYTNNNFRSDVFNVNLPCTLVSVLVYSTGSGNRTIQLQDSAGNVLQSATINIPNGTGPVTLNFPLTVGTNYQLGCGDNVTTTNLYRNETGAAFPYSDPSGYVTITGNNVPDNLHYYFFYDWKLQGPACVSARTPVVVDLSNGLTVTPNITPVACYGQSTGSVALTTSGGTPNYTYNWSNSQTTATASNLAAGTYQVTVTDAGGCSATAAETVTQPSAALTVNVTPTNATCNGTTNGAVNLTASGGTTNYTYHWTGGITTQNLSGVGAGNYAVTVTDAHSCSTTASATVGQPTAIVATPSVTNAGCGVSSSGSAWVAVSGGAGGYTYHWSNSGTTDTISNLTGGTYTVTITDIHSCTATASAIVNNSGSLTVTAAPVPATCYGYSNGSASVTVVGGTGTVTYTWTVAGSGPTVSNLPAGTYTVTVSDGAGCTNVTNEVVTQPDSISINLIASPACGISNGSVTATVSGGTTNYTYHWNTSASTPAIGGLSGGTSSVTVTDAHSCTASSSAVISTSSAVLANLIAVNATCNGEANGSVSATISTGNAPFTYLWNNNATTNAISNLTAGTYYVTITDSSGCQTNDSVTVNQPTAIVIVINASQPTCNGQPTGSASLSVTGGSSNYTYLWSTNSTNPSVSGLVPGGYSVTVTDGSGCSASSGLTINAISTVLANLTAFNDSCYGSLDGKIQASPTGGHAPYHYTWSNSGSTPTISNLPAGNYAVTISDANGCSTTGTVSVTQPNQIVITTTTTNATNGLNNGAATIDSINGGTSPYSVGWSNQASGLSITNLAPGIYTATVTDNNGCQQTVMDTVNNILGISNISGGVTFDIYPNPARTEVIVEVQSLTNPVEIRIKDVLGRNLFTKPVSSNKTVINLAPYASGMYLIEVSDGTVYSSRKLIIEK